MLKPFRQKNRFVEIGLENDMFDGEMMKQPVSH
jgi:hypothetical protein